MARALCVQFLAVEATSPSFNLSLLSHVLVIYVVAHESIQLDLWSCEVVHMIAWRIEWRGNEGSGIISPNQPEMELMLPSMSNSYTRGRCREGGFPVWSLRNLSQFLGKWLISPDVYLRVMFYISHRRLIVCNHQHSKQPGHSLRMAWVDYYDFAPHRDVSLDFGCCFIWFKATRLLLFSSLLCRFEI